MKHLKIAYIFDQFILDGAADNEQVINTVAALSNRGHELSLILPTPNNRKSITLEELQSFFHFSANFHVECIHSIFPAPRIVEKAAQAVFCTLLRKYLKEFDLIYCRNISILSSCIALNLPVFYDTYRPWAKQYPALKPYLKYLFSKSNFLGMSLHSDYARKCYLEDGFPSNKMIVAYNGYDKEKFLPILSKSEARNAIGLALEGKCALYAGRMSMDKGLDTIFNLAKGVPECTFILVGSQGQGDVETQAKRFTNIKMIGWKRYEELPAYLYAADVLLVPTSLGPLNKIGNTVLPIKLFSYLAAGRVIFAPHSPDTEELLSHDINACLVEPDNPELALNAFRELIRDDARLDRLSQSAYDLGKTLTWDKRASTLEAFFQSQLNNFRDNKK